VGGQFAKRPLIPEKLPRVHKKNPFDGAKKRCFSGEHVVLSEGANLFQKNLKKFRKKLTSTERSFTFCKM
jgi:hypothetical protein